MPTKTKKKKTAGKRHIPPRTGASKVLRELLLTNPDMGIEEAQAAVVKRGIPAPSSSVFYTARHRVRKELANRPPVNAPDNAEPSISIKQLQAENAQLEFINDVLANTVLNLTRSRPR